MIGGWKVYHVLENKCKSVDLWIWDKKKILFDALVMHVILYGCEVWGCNISRESWRKIEKIQKKFVTYNRKIKGNTPCPILLLEASLPPIESMAMTRYLIYKNKLKKWKMGGFQKFLQTLAITTFDSSGDGIKMPRLG